MIFRQKKIKKKRKKIYQVLKIIIFLVDFVPQSQHPSHIIPNYMCNPERKMSSQTLNVIPNLLRDLLIVPQNRSFQASLSGHPPRRRKLLLRWTAPQALQSLPLHKKFYACRKYKKNCIKHQNRIKEFLPKTGCIRMFILTENQFSSCALSQEEVDLQEYHIGAKDLVTL